MPNGEVYYIKKYVASLGDLRIEVYPKDHKPEHFHVISKQRNINARFDIKTLELVSTKYGKIMNSDIEKIQHLFRTQPNLNQLLRT
jgi:hypothetical protein